MTVTSGRISSQVDDAVVRVHEFVCDELDPGQDGAAEAARLHVCRDPLQVLIFGDRACVVGLTRARRGTDPAAVFGVLTGEVSVLKTQSADSRVRTGAHPNVDCAHVARYRCRVVEALLVGSCGASVSG